MKFGIIADPQYEDRDPRDGRDFRASLSKVREAIAFFNTQDLAFVMVLGDIVDSTIESFPPVLEILKTSRHKIYFAVGNHDYRAAGGNRQTLTNILNLKNTYYSWSENGYRFITLDTNEGTLSTPGFSHQKEHNLAHSEPKAQSIADINTDNHIWNGFILDEQQAWLKSELDAARAATEKIVIFGHGTLYPAVPERLQNSDEILELLLPYNNYIVAYLAGHFHPGAYAPFDRQIPYITFRALVNDCGTAYSIVDLDGFSIKTTGYGTENSYQFIRH